MEEKEKHIIHMDQDAFFVSVELRKNPKLLGKPVIVGGTADRGVVTSCSYEARKFGVHAAMPGKMAKQLCPQAIFVRGNMDDYSKASHEITEIIAERVPLFEKASIDEHYIDMTGMDKFFGCMKFASNLRQTIIRETGLPISFGLSVNKTVAKIGTNECKPNGQLEVPYPQVRPFLNPLAVHKIPGVGDATYKKLSEMGVRKIQTLAEIPRELMFKILGQHGLSLWQKANGIDLAPVVPYRERKSIGTQTTFESDSMDIEKMKSILSGMVTNLTYELRSQQKLTACITVTIRYSNFETVTQQARIPYTALDSFLITKAQDLFKRLYTKRMLLRLIGVRLSHLVNGFEQIGLYHTSEQEYDLYQAMDRVRANYGIESVVKACIVNPPVKDENNKVIKYNPRKNKVKPVDDEVDPEVRKKSRIRTFINTDHGSKFN
ncbi:DNA polymerase IV [Pedobacter sandarakinus]|uniref:DNA polymerase IV n=1 Tax=Pedobacter sandarakinus TaxID=353156 RepID=UPI00224703A9|nr:DNA polymerase IV [Pedobacter sandarakinus]MCX2574040.1 DNA polymerase IV [Pedobacter sandarakinus]